MRRLRLGKIAVRLWLHGMDDVGELDRVLDEEHRDVVADQIPIAFLSVKLDRKPPYIAREVGRAFTARHSGKSREHWRALAHALKNVRARYVRQRLGQLKEAM